MKSTGAALAAALLAVLVAMAACPNPMAVVDQASGTSADRAAQAARIRTSIRAIQYTTDPGGASPLAGRSVTVVGTVTCVVPNGFFLAEAPGPWNAIFIYSPTFLPVEGEKLRVVGTVAEYNGMTEIKDGTVFRASGRTSVLPPAVVTALEAGTEACESVLVSLADVVVASTSSTGDWMARDASGTLACGTTNDRLLRVAP